jgi:glucose-1-phosphate cytidylyltransferase
MTSKTDTSIPVVILCGGKGMRIRQVSDLVPKPLLPIGDQPILWHIMRIYAQCGFNRFVLCLGYKGDEIRDYFFNYYSRSRDVTLDFSSAGPPKLHYHPPSASEPDFSVTLAETGAAVGTGARVARVLQHIDHEEFFLTYGDGVGDIDVAASLRYHRQKGGLITITGVQPQTRFGHIEADGDEVTSFAEKPKFREGYVSGGFMVGQREFVTRYLSQDSSCSLEDDGLSGAANEGNVRVYRHEGFWLPMDNHSEYEILNDLYASGNAPWKTW